MILSRAGLQVSGVGKYCAGQSSAAGWVKHGEIRHHVESGNPLGATSRSARPCFRKGRRVEHGGYPPAVLIRCLKPLFELENLINRDLPEADVPVEFPAPLVGGGDLQ